MGSINGAVDGAALSTLARGVGATKLAEIDEVEAVCLQVGYGTPRELPIELRPDEPDDDNDEDDLGVRCFVYADRGAVALACRDARPVRWTYLGTVLPASGACRAELITADEDSAFRWHDDRWKLPALAQSADGALRVVQRPDQPWMKAVLADGGKSRIQLYVGFDDAEDAVVVVLDASGVGGVRDDRDGEEELRAARDVLATPGPCSIPQPRRFEGFVPNLAEGVPRFEDDVGPMSCELTATHAGTLPLPSRMIGLVLGAFTIGDQHASAWPVAADRVDVFAFYRPGGLAAWMLRVEGALPLRWGEVGFEDQCIVGDGAGGAGLGDANLSVAGEWPQGDVGFARNAGGVPLVCIRGPDLSVARGFVGLDADGRMTTLVVVS